jgi:hypothetical protein
MTKKFKSIDFYLQLILIVLVLISSFFQFGIGFIFLWALGFIQSISIVYHCIFLKTKFNTLRYFHYYGTTLVLLILFTLYTLSFSNIKIDSLSILVFVLLLSAILCISYLILTAQEKP